MQTVAHFAERAAGHHSAVDNHAHAVAQALDKAENVGAQDYRLAFGAQFLKEIGDGARREHVESVGGLVEDDDVGVVHERDDNRHLLLHTR